MNTILRLLLLIIFICGGPQVALAKSGQAHRNVEFDWDPIDGATKYELRVTRILANGKKKKPNKFVVKEPKWNGNINPGKYEMQLRSFDERGVPGEWSEASQFWVKIPPPKPTFPEHESELITNEDEEYELNLKWVDSSGAKKYKIEIESEDKKYNKVFTADEKEYEVDLPVAKRYYWRVTALMGDGTTGEVNEEWDEFVLLGEPLSKPDIEKPFTRFVTKVNWEKPKRAKTYHYQVYRKKKGQWNLVEEIKDHPNNTAPFDLSRPPGKYRVFVKAKAPHTQDSKVAKVQFRAAGNLRSPAAVQKAILKESLKKPTRWYGIASYFITQMDYTGKEHVESGGKSGAIGVVGGTGRLGLGYQHPRRKYGYFGVVDLSGFLIKDDNPQFASVELHYTYEPWKKKIGNSYQAKFTGGFYTKELPHIVSDSNERYLRTNIISQYGLHAGFRYWQPLSEKYGYQLNARLYQSFGGAAEAAKSLDNSMAFQAGFLGSYRLSKKIMGLAGYAYRLDSVEFTPKSCAGSACPGGAKSFSEVQGHYLNLILEISF